MDIIFQQLYLDFLTIFSFSTDSELLFTCRKFWIFFAVILVGFAIIYKKSFLRSLYLLAFSVFFYYKLSGLYFILLVLTTIADYFIGQRIYKAHKATSRKALIVGGVAINLLLLAYFKYSYFFIDSINQIFGTNWQVINYFAQLSNNILGSEFNISKIILPVGISFYIFQAIGYLVDIYRGKLEPVKNIIDFGFFVSFFPQLVAGPIVRATEFIPQIYQKFNLTKEDFGRAIFLILNGLIKKMIISDYISINFIDRVFDNPASYTGFENLMAVYGYAIQIYCDFSGYTDIAIGLALILGFQLPINFDSPYKSNNITNFWRRWHISLSTWLRDYLYISLGGNRKGKIRQYINLLLTMLLGGLWHGASVNFIIWGGLHGFALAIHKIWMKYFPFSDDQDKIYRILTTIFTFHFICFAWIFFRASSFNNVSIILSKIWTDINISMIPQIVLSYKNVFAIIALGYLIHWLPSKFKEQYKSIFIKSPIWIKILICVICVIFVYQAQSADVQPFIYFQF